MLESNTNNDNDTISNYYASISKRLKAVMKQRDITQEFLVKKCTENLNIPFGQSTASKIINYKGKGHLSLVYVVAICQIMGLDMNEYLAIKGVDYSDFITDNADISEYSHTEVGRSETLISKPDHSAFNGYVGYEFDLFFLPTISSEHGLIEGTLSLFNKDNNYCGTHLSIPIKTGRKTKEYYGKMLISLQQQACYINLVSDRLGELCSIYFRHRFFSDSSLKVRLATAITISAGDSKRPTMHRVAVCEKNIVKTKEQRDFLESQLLLNDSQIVIAEEDFEYLSASSPDLYAAIKNLARPKDGKKYYVFEESDIQKMPDTSFSAIMEIIGQLRRKAGYKKYNKIGAKPDETLFKFLFNV
jgi:hypothetical protein